MVYELTITNKKYQPVKVFLSNTETLFIGSKETKKVRVLEVSQHLSDLEQDKVLVVTKKAVGEKNGGNV